MPEPDDGLDFSHKDERSHTIKKPHPEPLPVSLRDWLVSVLQRLLNPASSDEDKGEDKKEDE